MSTILRTFRNLRKIGIKEYAHQLQNIGDTKAGTYIASDRYGNKYYENLEDELPCKRLPINCKQHYQLYERIFTDPNGVISAYKMGRLQGARI